MNSLRLLVFALFAFTATSGCEKLDNINRATSTLTGSNGQAYWKLDRYLRGRYIQPDFVCQKDDQYTFFRNNQGIINFGTNLCDSRTTAPLVWKFENNNATRLAVNFDFATYESSPVLITYDILTLETNKMSLSYRLIVADTVQIRIFDLLPS